MEFVVNSKLKISLINLDTWIRRNQWSKSK